MRRPSLLVGAAALVAAAVAAAAGASLVSVYSTHNSVFGAILVSANGRTLYHDAAEHGTVKCVGTCATQWPPLLIGAGAKPVAGPGVVASKLGTVKRPDGGVQVTYAGLPLYRYAGDRKAGDVKGQGAGGIWHVIAPSGAAITKSGPATPSSSSSGAGSSPGSSAASSGGSGGSSAPSGAGSSTGGTGGGSGTNTDCAANPGGYGCM